jgi:hypothetical protein
MSLIAGLLFLFLCIDLYSIMLKIALREEHEYSHITVRKEKYSLREILTAACCIYRMI